MKILRTQQNENGMVIEVSELDDSRQQRFRVSVRKQSGEVITTDHFFTRNEADDHANFFSSILELVVQP